MAGNIPLVGFHDFLCVFITGHYAVIKPSSKDVVLIRHLVQKLYEWEANVQNCVSFAEIIKGLRTHILPRAAIIPVDILNTILGSTLPSLEETEHLLLYLMVLKQKKHLKNLQMIFSYILVLDAGMLQNSLFRRDMIS
jgi:hypothetical protein